MQIKPIILIILDGWGYRKNPDHNAILNAHTPHWDHWWATYPHTLISGSGSAVGLPEGQMGNSEVGHIHMGAGRRIPQDLVRINEEIQSGKFNQNPALNEAIDRAIENNSQLHLIGLVSPGGVHSHERHMEAMIKLAAHRGLKKVCVHAILDGRDTPPQSALPSIANIDRALKEKNCGHIASVIGRFYAMDRDNRWDRIQIAFDLLVNASGAFHYDNSGKALEEAYERGESDEFVQASAISHDGQFSKMNENDAVIFMNFRADRARQLSRALSEKNMNHFPRSYTPHLSRFVTLTKYADDINAEIAYPPIKLSNVFGEIIANDHLHQLRLAETEKYAHVTFFFNGGREKPFINENRILIPSAKVHTYDEQPEMCAPELTDKLIDAINSQQYDVIICNFANADMVGHTGNYEATIKAIECIDTCLGRIITALQEVGGEAIITADHGNAEFMYDELTGQAHTAHTNNPVPVLYIGRPATVMVNEGDLTDIAPTLCTLLNIPIPKEMTGKPLFKLQGI